MDCIIACKQYDDFLRLTIPHTIEHFGKVIVITSEDDTGTLECCREHDVMCIPTTAWTYGGAILNKGRTLNVGLSQVTSEWVCALDADIILPPDFSQHATDLDSDCLYSAKRRMCRYKSELKQEWGDYPLYEVPLEKAGDHMCLWGSQRLITTNSAALLGYLQIWHNQPPKSFNTSRGISQYDVEFATMWPHNKRRWLDCEVLHLGMISENWMGRQSERWD